MANEHRTIFQQSETVTTDDGTRGQWVHISLDQMRDLYPAVPFSTHCETPACAGKRNIATIFHAVFSDANVDTWVSCWDCFQMMEQMT